MKVISDRDIANFYQLLELPLNSSPSLVKAAYHALARKYHPDRAFGDPSEQKSLEERFKQINAAYEFLKTYKPRVSPTVSAVPKKTTSNPSNSRITVSVSRTSERQAPPGSIHEARRLQALGNLEEALMELDVAIALQDGFYVAYELRSEIRLALGNTYGSERDLKLAKHYYWLQTGQELLSPASKPSKEKYNSSPQTTNAAKTTVEPKSPQPRPDSPTASYARSSFLSSGWSKTVGDQDIERFYQLLELPFDSSQALIELPLDSSQALIEESYQTLAREYHAAQAIDPTQQKTSEQHFRHINIAYEFLKTYTPKEHQNKSVRVSDVPQTTPINPFSQKPPDVGTTVQTKPSQFKSEPLYKQPQILQTFVGHLDTISQILFVDRSMISASHDGSVRIWNIETGELQGSLKVGAAVTAIAASPNSNLFITGDRNGKIKMWDLATDKLIRSIPLHTGSVTGIHFSPNGRSFATTGEDGILKLFQLQPASLRHSLQVSAASIFSSGLFLGGRFFTVSADSKLRGIDSGMVILESELPSPLCKTMAIDLQKRWVAIGDDRASVHCFTTNGDLVKSFAAFPEGEIRSLEFLAGGNQLIIAGASPLIKIWNVATGDLVVEWEVGASHSTAVASSGKQVAIAVDQTIQLWQLP